MKIEKNKASMYIVILALVLVAMFIVLGVYSQDRSEGQGAVLLPVGIEEVESLVVENPNDGYEIKFKNGSPSLCGVKTELIDSAKCVELALDLLSLNTGSLQGATRFPLGLRAPLATVTINYEVDGKAKKLKLKLGNEAPASLGRYAKVEGRRGVFVIPEEVTEQLLAPRLDFVSLVVFKDLKETAFEDWRLEFYRQDKEQTLSVFKRAGENALEVSNGTNKFLDSGALKKRVENLLWLQAAEVQKVAPSPEDIDLFKLFSPYAQVVLQVGQTKELLKISEPEAGVCFCLTSSNDIIFRCNESEVLFGDAIWEPEMAGRILAPNDHTVKRLAFSMGGKELQLEKQGVSWQVLVDGKAKEGLDGEELFGKLLEILAELSATGGEQKIFAEEPKVGLKIFYDSEETSEYSFFEEEGKAYLFCKAYEDCFKLETEKLNSLTSALDLVLKGQGKNSKEAV